MYDVYRRLIFINIRAVSHFAAPKQTQFDKNGLSFPENITTSFVLVLAVDSISDNPAEQTFKQSFIPYVLKTTLH